MSKILENIDLFKNVIGKFKDDKDYLDAVKTLINCTDETKNRINIIESSILPSVGNENVLDIGVGNGEITHILCNHFKNIHLLDPSQDALNSINKDNFNHKIIEYFCISLEKFQKKSDFYDLIMVSHTLYYIDRKLWKHIIQNLFDSLKPGGCILIVLNNGLDRSKLTHFFGENDALKIEQLIEECTTIENASLELCTTHEIFQPKSLEDALRVVGVCFYDVKIEVERKATINYLNKNLRDRSFNKYSISFIQYFLTLRKNK